MGQDDCTFPWEHDHVELGRSQRGSWMITTVTCPQGPWGWHEPARTNRRYFGDDFMAAHAAAQRRLDHLRTVQTSRTDGRCLITVEAAEGLRWYGVPAPKSEKPFR